MANLLKKVGSENCLSLDSYRFIYWTLNNSFPNHYHCRWKTSSDSLRSPQRLVLRCSQPASCNLHQFIVDGLATLRLHSRPLRPRRPSVLRAICLPCPLLHKFNNSLRYVGCFGSLVDLHLSDSISQRKSSMLFIWFYLKAFKSTLK